MPCCSQLPKLEPAVSNNRSQLVGWMSAGVIHITRGKMAGYGFASNPPYELRSYAEPLRCKGTAPGSGT